MKLRILQIVPQFPYPPTDGGKIGIVNITREFTRLGHHVHLFAVSAEAIGEERRRLAAGDTAALTIVQADTRNSPGNILRSLFSRLPLFVWKHQRPAVLAALRRLCREQEFDVIHADHSSMIPLALLARAECAKPAGLRLHNVEWVIWQRYAERFPRWRPEYVYAAWQAQKLRRFETQGYAAMDVCFPITEQDRGRAGRMQPGGRYVLASAGVNLEEWRPDVTLRRPEAVLVLATTFTWVHNVEAVRWLVEAVFPLVQAGLPEVRLEIIGKNPPLWLQNVDNPAITVTGFVEAVQPFLSGAQVYCAPLFVGGGIRIKILEAMAMELPVVATPVSAEGIRAGEGDGLFLAETADGFAKHILYLCRHSERARAAGQAARRFIEREHTWKHSVGTMVGEYEALVNSKDIR